MALMQVEPTQRDTRDELPTAVDLDDDVARRQARWIEATLRSLPYLRTYPSEKIGVVVDRSRATTVLWLQLPSQLDSAGLATTCRWARRAAIDFDPARPVHIEIGSKGER